MSDAAPAVPRSDPDSAPHSMPASPRDGAAPTAAELARLEQARQSLLRVHRALLTVERQRYEAVQGRVANNSAFLQLVISDPWFAWLRPMALLVLLIDERTSDKKSPLDDAEASALLQRARTMLQADADGDTFQRLYAQAIQFSPEMAVLSRQVAAGLSG